MVESQPSKLLVAGSIPVSRSSMKLETRKWKVETTEFPSGQSSVQSRVSFTFRFARRGPM
jgi:hypothetical protein